MRDERDPNANPWYVLMTLEGEQEGAFDEALHARNVLAWTELEYAPRRAGISERWQGIGRFSDLARDNWGRLARHFELRKPSGTVKRPPAATPIALNSLTFPNPLHLDGFSFGQPVSFKDCIFEGHVSMNDCLFAGGLDLSGAVFRKGLSFKGSGCIGALNARRLVGAGPLSFSKSRFGATVTMTHLEWTACVGRISFNSTVFEGFAHLSDAQFPAFTVFENATFQGRTMFSRTVFEKGASFRGVVFEDYSYFQGSRFCATAGTQYDHINFTESRFERPPTFRRATFEGEFPNFAGAILHERSDFTGEDDQWPLPATLAARDTKASATSASVAIESAATLRALMSRQGLPEEEHFFFRREMDMRAHSEPFKRSALISVYGAISQYGGSIKRPLYWLAGLIAVFAVFYAAHFDYADRDMSGMAALSKGVGLSFTSTVNLFGFQRLYFGELLSEAGPRLKVATALQTLLGYVFLFFLGLGLRQRFRLR